RLHAAWLLSRLGGLDNADLLRLLRDTHPRLREHGVLLAEEHLAKNKEARQAVLALADRGDARLRFQVALSLGEWDDDASVDPLARIALGAAEDEWTRLAVASAVPRRAGLLIASLCRHEAVRSEAPRAGRLTLMEELAAQVGSRRDTTEVAGTLTALAGLPGRDRLRWQMAGLNGLAQGMGRRGGQLATFLTTLPADEKGAARQAMARLDNAARLASDRKRDLPERLAAIGLLAHATWATAGPVLKGLLNEPSQEVRLAAVRALSAHSRPEVAGLLLQDWRGLTPALRRGATAALLRQPDRGTAALRALGKGNVQAGGV